MVKTSVVGIILAACLLISPAWPAPASPSLMATPPQPKWSDLSVPQKIVLAPLSDDWDSMENHRQKKWLNIVARFSDLSPEEQRRIQSQMQEWGKLSTEERRLARENFKAASQLPSEKKQELKQKWEEYSNLPDEEKEKLKEMAETRSAAKPVLPSAPPPLTAPTVPAATESSPAPAVQPGTESPARP